MNFFIPNLSNMIIAMHRFFIFSCFLSCCSFVQLGVAEDFVLKDGRVLKEATVSDKGLDFVRVHHSDGIAKISYKDLTEPMQKRFQMTTDEVAERMDARQRREQAQQTQAKQRAQAMRDSLSEAERVPRYVTGADISRVMVSFLDLSPIEAEYAAILWNMSEARRVGLEDQSKGFQEQLVMYEPRMKEVKAQRNKDKEKSDQEQEQMEKALAKSNEQIAKLQNRISGLQGDLMKEKNDNSNRAVFVSPPVWVSPRPSIIINRPIVRPPCPIYPSRPISPCPNPPSHIQPRPLLSTSSQTIGR
ncbi:MAG: hypothetical protein RR719_01780 [Akkermansia sp.]